MLRDYNNIIGRKTGRNTEEFKKSPPTRYVLQPVRESSPGTTLTEKPKFGKTTLERNHYAGKIVTIRAKNRLSRTYVER